MRMGGDSTTIRSSYRLPPHDVDGPQHFARLHDQFLDSLLHEQVVLAQQQRPLPSPHSMRRSTSSKNGGDLSSCAGYSVQSKDSWTTVLHPPTIVLRKSGHRSSSTASAASTCGSESTSGPTSTAAPSSTSTSSCGNNLPHIATGRKRRRGPNLRVHRRKASPSALRQTKKKSANHYFYFSTTNNNTPSASSNLETIHLEDFSSATSTTSAPTAVTSPLDHHQHRHVSLSPHEYLHPHCRIQKDKGKGDPIGSKICGKTAETTLSKLRAKMLLLTEHCCQTGSGHSSSSSSNSNNNNMKRRPALVSKWSVDHGGVCETRSILTLKMGFLSMTYGILLRWDVTRSHQITLVVLRKNCHESFYKVSMPSAHTNSGSFSSLWFPPTVAERRAAPPLSPRRRSETRVTVLYATGLNTKTKHHNWTVQMNVGDETEHVLLSPPKNDDDDGFDHDNSTGSSTNSCGGHNDGTMLVPRSNNATIIIRSSDDGHHNDDVDDELVLQLFEHRRHTKVLRCTLRIPTASLVVVPPQEQQQSLEPTQLRVPVPDGGYLQLEAMVRETMTSPQRAYDDHNDPSSSSALYPLPRLAYDDDLTDQQYQQRHDCGGWEYLLCMVC
jgi:hypothetical protein